MLLTLDWKGQGVKAIPGIDRRDRERREARSREGRSMEPTGWGPVEKRWRINTHHSWPALRSPISSHWNQSASRGQAFTGVIHTGRPPKAQSRTGRVKTGSRGVNGRHPAHLKTRMHTSMTQALPTSPSTYDSLDSNQPSLQLLIPVTPLMSILRQMTHHVQNRTNQRDCLRTARIKWEHRVLSGYEQEVTLLHAPQHTLKDSF